jgi:hypothetical protein
LLGDIYRRPDEALESRSVSYRNRHATYVTNLSTWSHNPLREVESAMVGQHLLHPLLHEFPIFRVHEIQIFLYCRRLAARIKAVDPEQLGRPVIESSSIECPATHMSQALPLAEVKLGSPQGLLGAPAVVDVGSRTVPSYDLAALIFERVVLKQPPPGLPALHQNARLHLEWCPAQKPLLSFG